MKKETDRFGTEHGIHKAQHRKMIDLHIVAVRQENPFAGKLHDPGRSIDLTPHSASK